MKKNSLRLMLILTVLASLLLASCQGQSEAPANEDAMKVVFLGESSSTDIIWAYRADKMAELAKILGIDFSFRFAEGDYAAHAQMIEEETTRGVDAIIGPWWDDSIYNDAFTKAVNEGVIVYGILGIAPRENLPDDIVEKLAWADFDWYEWGREAGKEAVKIIPDNGNVFWPAEVPSGTYITDAVEGLEDVFAENGKSVNVEVIEATADPTTSVSRISAYLLANPDIDALITSGAIAIDAANVAYRDLGLEPGAIPLIGQVVSPDCARGIKEGYMPFGVNLELTDSSYYALIDVWAVHVLGVNPPKGKVGFSIITSDNIATDVPEALQK